MAPQSETFYGSVKIAKQSPTKAESPLLKRVLLVVGAVALGSFAVFALSGSGTNEEATRRLVALEEVDEASVLGGGRAFPGMDIVKWGEDCVCAQGSCPGVADTSIGNGKHYCAVENINCMGADYAAVVGTTGDTLDPVMTPTGYCTTHTDDLTAPCKAVCDFVDGEYDCWNWPCVNGGYCKDGDNEFSCICATGFTGQTCSEDIDECDITDFDINGDGAVVQEVDHVHVCDTNALCTNAFGAYNCECGPGWQGMGYRSIGTLDAPEWMTAISLETGITFNCIDIDDCATAPCQNGGSCLNSVGEVDGWSCECALGPTGDSNAWVGRDCSEDVDECANNAHDCDVSAECINTPGGFECVCHKHWEPTDPCGDDHRGRTIVMRPEGADLTVAPYSECALDTQGTAYSSGCYDVDDCASEPCKNGGTCDGSGRPGCQIGAEDVACYVCSCTIGWTGENCERDENECVDSELGERIATLPAVCRAAESSTCTNTDGSYECRCNLGWTGDGMTCVDADDCEFDPCNHGGTCNDCGTLCFVCDCVSGWRGTTCATDWNECVMGIHQCNDEALCLNNPGSYDCRCGTGWEGNGVGASWVEHRTWTVGTEDYSSDTQHGCKDIDDCQSKLYDFDVEGDVAGKWKDGPCQFGTCENKLNGHYVCTCSAGYTDSNCDFNINECDSRTGSHDCDRIAATCTDISPGPEDEKGWTCRCNDGYFGDGVSCLDVDDCSAGSSSGETCAHGFCTDLGASSFRCTCDNGWKDRLCDQDVNECSDYTHECPRNADCSNTQGSYTCECSDGFAGDGNTDCRDVNDCASYPCANGECTDGGVRLYSCVCSSGWMDYNCDFDIDECTTGSHNCHPMAKCVNLPGTFMCRCFSGMSGDGVNECNDMNDCEPDPCDPEHGTCEDLGPDHFTCNCDDGWGCNAFNDCKNDCDECDEGSHSCDANADCTNNPGSYDCECRNPIEDNGGGYYDIAGARQGECLPCTICEVGYRVLGTCIHSDRDCENIDECAIPHPSEENACDLNARCDDTDGSYTCECNQGGEGNEWWGTGIVTDNGDGCRSCTVCYEGFHEVAPCTSTTDRVCERDISAFVPQSGSVTGETTDNVHVGQTTLPFDANNAPGKFVVRSEADDNMMCLTIADGDWYPSRVDYGNSGTMCGIPDDSSPADYPQLMWSFVGLGDNTLVDHNSGMSNQYLIRYNDRQGKCLFFGDFGKDIYPSLQHCKDYEHEADCPWLNSRGGQPYCGFQKDGISKRDGLMKTSEGHQAVWKVATVKLNEAKFMVQSSGSGETDVAGNLKFECLVFEKQGASTNPSRYNWGNGDSFCGVGNWEDQGKDIALLGNKQAIFILTAI